MLYEPIEIEVSAKYLEKVFSEIKGDVCLIGGWATFHTFRHFKATMEYHKTKDILHVMRILGHRNINNTLIYTQLVDFKDDEYTVKVAHSIEEDKELIEAGFEYITDRDNFKIYRKRK